MQETGGNFHQNFLFPPWSDRIAAVLPVDIPIYLVGGAVRDALLGRETHDLDFVLPGDVLKIARVVANRLGLAFFPLDEERDTARLVLIEKNGERVFFDFAAYRGSDLYSDLRGRDFTINAMAVDIRQPSALIDPMKGAEDLVHRRLRACTESSLQDDPLRVLRAVRIARNYDLKISAETQQLMHKAVPGLSNISSERLRDELFRILGDKRPGISIQALDIFGALHYVLPELETIKGVEQSAPHVSDVWQHTLSVVDKLALVLDVLGLDYHPDEAANLSIGLAVMRLGRYRQQIDSHLKTPVNLDRSLKPLIFLGALYHDIGKPETRTVEGNGRTRFFGHDERGEELITARADMLRLSNAEILRLKRMVRYHMRPVLLANTGKMPSRKAIYRFFRDTGPAGVDICLLSLADVLATYGPTLPADLWAHHLDVVRAILEAWWEHPEESIKPPMYVNGHDLMEAFNLQPGPVIGELLEAIREASAAGQVRSREEALEFSRSLLENSAGGPSLGVGRSDNEP